MPNPWDNEQSQAASSNCHTASYEQLYGTYCGSYRQRDLQMTEFMKLRLIEITMKETAADKSINFISFFITFCFLLSFLLNLRKTSCVRDTVISVIIPH